MSNTAHEYFDELHTTVHGPTMGWLSAIREGKSPDYYLSPKVLQATRCLAFDIFCDITGSEGPDDDEDTRQYMFYVFMVSLGAALQSAVIDGDIKFEDVIGDDALDNV